MAPITGSVRRELCLAQAAAAEPTPIRHVSFAAPSPGAVAGVGATGAGEELGGEPPPPQERAASTAEDATTATAASGRTWRRSYIAAPSCASRTRPRARTLAARRLSSKERVAGGSPRSLPYRGAGPVAAAKSPGALAPPGYV